MIQKHSGLGIASFIIAIVAGALMLMAILAAGVMQATTPGGIDEQSAGAILLGLFMMALMLVDLLAIGLGIAGLLQKDRQRVFPDLGTIFAGVAILGTTALAVIGNMM